MAEFLLELFSEEIPARMQVRAEEDLLASVSQGLKASGLNFSNAFSCSGPRRLTVVVEGLDAETAALVEQRKGPKVTAPEAAIQGFLKSAGLNSVDEAEIVDDPKKGKIYCVTARKQARKAREILPDVVNLSLGDVRWPKSMRSGHSEFRWVRPLLSVLAVLDGKKIDLEVGGVKSGTITHGHRILGRGPFEVSSWDEYVEKLEGDGHVLLRREFRKSKILQEATNQCHQNDLELIHDEHLLNEVTGLVEWPVALLGKFGADFLKMPADVIRLTLRTHQKYFSVRDLKTGRLAPNFVVIANQSAPDGGAEIIRGNEKVLTARLEDARFFWAKDLETPLEEMYAKLEHIEFKDKLGNMREKSDRVSTLAERIFKLCYPDDSREWLEFAKEAGRLCKVDLVSNMVQEFPELQGKMGRLYAENESFDSAVAEAIGSHYSPVGPSDSVPTHPVSVAVALADKFDTLCGFWDIGERTSGSRDPYALRRTSLGIVRIVLQNGLRFDLSTVIKWATGEFQIQRAIRIQPSQDVLNPGYGADFEGLLKFFATRLRQYLRDEGENHELIDAVFAAEKNDLVLIVQRVKALSSFLVTEEGKALMAGYNRAVSFLKAEEAKDGRRYNAFDKLDVNDLTDPAEENLYIAVATARMEISEALEAADFVRALGSLANLRSPVDEFFEKLLVNSDDREIRMRRLLLLGGIRESVHSFADFS